MSAAATTSPVLTYTTFTTVTDNGAHQVQSTWAGLVEKLTHPDEYASKKACPLLKLATFGNKRSLKGFLRHGDNMGVITGIEGDYDGETVSIEQASAMLKEARITAVFYTSPSHTTRRPRWRVLAPLAQAHPLAERKRFVGMLNTALGGILAPESFVDAQTFFYGKVTGSDYLAIRVMGHQIDTETHSGIEATYPTHKAPRAAAAPPDDFDRAIVLSQVTPQTLLDLQAALSIDPATGSTWIDPDDRGVWVAVAHDLKGLGEPGYELWLTWSAISAKFGDGRSDPRHVWDGCEGGRADYRAVFAKAQAGGWINPRSALALAASTTATNRVDRSDMGNVNKLAELTGGDIRYIPDGKHWISWSGQQWKSDHACVHVQSQSLRVAEYYATEAAKLRTQAQKSAMDSTVRKHLERAAEILSKWVINCRNSTALCNIRARAKEDSRFVLSADQLDANAWLFGVSNGVVDLRTGTLKPDSRDEFVTRRSPVAFNPNATAPRWHQFIREITAKPATPAPGGFEYRPELAHYLQKALGYSLTGSAREHKMFIAVGDGANGKSVLLDTVLRVLGDYGQPMAPEALMSNGKDVDAERATPFKFKLVGARAAISSESKDGQKLDMGMVKQHTGGGQLTARNAYSTAIAFEITHKLWLMTNNKPGIDHLDAATRDRLHIIPFDMRWNRPGIVDSDSNKPDGDKTLLDTLKTESEGVLAWLVAGALAYQREGLSPPAEVARMTRDYFDEQDPFSQWLATCEVCDIKQGALAATLFSEFRQWCGSLGLDAALAGTQARFSLKLKAEGIKNVKTRQGITYGLCFNQGDDLA